MSELIVLVVPDNGRQFRQLESAIRAVGVGEILQVSGGDEAVRWLDQRRCDVCVLAYELPGKQNGLDTLLDIRSHRPDLPVIMISRSGSEKVAIGAFHAGVVDYVPISRGYEHAVANLVSQIKVAPRGSQIVPAQIIPSDMDECLLEANYQNHLRAIGRHLDTYGLRRINVLQVDGGFIVRATPAHSRETETLEFIDEQFPQLLAVAATDRGEGERREQPVSKLIPTGYEDFLRALGYRLDQHAAEAVTISELDELAVVGGVGRVDETGVSRYGQIQWLLHQDDIVEMLNGAYRRRQARQAAVSGGLFRRRSG